MKNEKVRCRGISIFHQHIKIISRGAGKSAVAAAAYRSGTKIKSEYDGLTHDYTKKSGVGHCEILLPEFAPSELKDRATLWNEVERIEKARNSQLARDIEISIPREIPESQWVDLIREYCKRNFVDHGMICDFAIHNKNDGNPHAHLLLTMRPFNQDGTWGAKCSKEYLLDKNGERLLDKKGKPKTRRADTTDWNKRENAELWREDWAKICNSYLEQNGVTEKIDHRSYERQGIEKIPNIHNSIAVTEMEKRGIPTERGQLYRDIFNTNKDMSITRARITRLMKWQREERAKPLESIDTRLNLDYLGKSHALNRPEYKRRTNTRNSIKVMAFMLNHNITDLESFCNTVEEINKNFYVMKGDLKLINEEISELQSRVEAFEEYQEVKGVLKKYNDLPKRKQKKFREENRADLEKAEEHHNDFTDFKNRGGKIEYKKWKNDLVRLHSTGNLYVIRMKEFQGELRKAELLKDVFDEQISEERQTQRVQEQTREQTSKPKRKGDDGR